MEKIKKTYPADTIPLFLSFCIEQYKHSKGINGREAMEELAVSGALNYLEDNYEILHTQSPQWILEEIDEFLTKRNTFSIPPKP